MKNETDKEDNNLNPCPEISYIYMLSNLDICVSYMQRITNLEAV